MIVDVEDALYVAAPRGDGSMLGRATPSDDQLAAVRSIVVSFLENIPDDATALEIRLAIEQTS